MFESDFAQTIALTLKLSAVTTCILFFIAVPIAYFIAFAKFKIGRASCRERVYAIV